eukprot:gene2484-3193_t
MFFNDFLKKVGETVGLTEKQSQYQPKRIDIDLHNLMPTLDKCSSSLFSYHDYSSYEIQLYMKEFESKRPEGILNTKCDSICKSINNIQGQLENCAELWGENYQNISESTNDSISQLTTFFEDVKKMRETFESRHQQHQNDNLNDFNKVNETLNEMKQEDETKQKIEVEEVKEIKQEVNESKPEPEINEEVEIESNIEQQKDEQLLVEESVVEQPIDEEPISEEEPKVEQENQETTIEEEKPEPVEESKESIEE